MSDVFSPRCYSGSRGDSANHRYPNTLTSLVPSLLPPLAKSELFYARNVEVLARLIILYRRRKPDSPSAPVRAADYKILTDFD